MVRNGTGDGATVSASQVSCSPSVGELLADIGSLFLQTAMGWFLGCFGRGRKGRKQCNRAASVSHKPSPTPAPVRMPTSASIPIIKVPVREGPGCEDLFKVRQVLCSSFGSAAQRINQENSRLLPLPVCSPSPTRRANEILVQESETAARQECTPGISSKVQSLHSVTNPWSHLDDLDQELDEISEQIGRESDDAMKIKDEVAFLKSCGTLLQTPAEIRNIVPSPERQSVHERVRTSWRSWLLPSSPTAKPEVNTNHVNEDLHAPLCAPTPAKECHGLLRGVKTPDFDGSTLRRAQINLESSLEALPQAISNAGYWVASQQEKECNVDAPFSFNEKMVQSTDPPASVTFPKASLDSQEQPQDVFSRPYVSVESELESTVGMERERLIPKANAEKNRSSDQVEVQTSDYSQHAGAVANLVKRRSSGCATAREVPQNQNQWMRDVKIQVNEGQSTPRADSSPSHQKRLKILPAEHSIATGSSTEEDPSKPAGLHQLRGSKCAVLSPILESGVSIDESSSCCKESFSSSSPRSVKARRREHACENTVSPSNSISHCHSITCTRKDSMHSPISWAKSVPFTCNYSGNCAAQAIDGIAIPDGAVSESGYFMSSLAEKIDVCRFDSSEIQDDSLSPSSSPSRRERVANCKGEPYICYEESAGSVAEKETIKPIIRGSDKYAGAVWNQLSQSEYEITGDDVDLFSDTVSHAPAESNGRDEDVRECADSPDSLNTQQLCNVVEPVYLVHETPLKLCESITTPEIEGAGKHWRLRSKRISSVLIPVENLSQWNRVKETNSPRLNKTEAKASSARQILASTVSKENKHGERGDASLSHWLKPTSPRARDDAKSKSSVGNHTPPGLGQGQRERPCGWDGMGIPNSTTKYKEDQKVSWHETPFEVRLERALDKQGVAFQKKLFQGPSTSFQVRGVNQHVTK